MSLIKHLFIFLFLSFAFISCNKPCKDHTDINIDQATLDYFGIYKPGSFWVYQNSDSTEKDSLYVIYYHKRIEEGTKKPDCKKTEKIEIRLQSTGKNLIVDGYAILYVERNGYHSVTTSGNHWLGNTQGMNTYSDTLTGIRTRKLKSISLNSKTFSGDITEVNDIYPMYLQRKVGIIGWKKDDKTFHLIRYNIAQ